MILGLLVRYGTDRYPTGTADGIAAFRRLAAGRESELVVIDNALSASAHGVVEPGVPLRGGDNAVREFTAWDLLLTERLPGLRDDDIVVLITDALRQADADHLDAISPTALDLLSEWPTAYGHLDALPSPVVIRGLGMAAYLRSSFLALSAYAVRSVLPLATVRPESLFRSTDDPLSFYDHVTPTLYREMLTDWVRGRPLSTGFRYHAGRDLHERSTEDFQAKCACVVDEHLLSARLVARGIQLVDMEWWTQQDVSIHHEIADPGEQLAWRRRELVG